jgi:hypothetical protein
VFSIAPPSLFVLLQFFELPSDALNFEIQVMRFGIRRFQSLAFAGQGFLFLLLIYYNVRSFFSWRAAYLMPLAIGVLGLSLLSGHRWVVAIVGATVLLCAYAQRFYTVRNSIKIAAVLIVSFALLHVGAERMPLAFQRAISFVPGVPIATQAQADAASTVSMRTALIQVGLQLIPVYFWIGRGFARFSDDPFAQWEPTGMTAHVNQGVFYNGFIGLMVNTGLFGTIFMLVFLVATSACAWRIMQHLRQQGCEDNFSRVACIAASLWFANVIGFLLLHGDSEFAMKTFSMQAGLLLVCDSLLRRRLTAAAPAA